MDAALHRDRPQVISRHHGLDRAVLVSEALSGEEIAALDADDAVRRVHEYWGQEVEGA